MNKRPYAGTSDLRAMQKLVQEVWSHSSRWHIGDLAWGRFSHEGRESEWPTMLWERDGSVLAWGWVRLPDELDWMVRPDHPQLAAAVLDWFECVATDDVLSVNVLERETHLVNALTERGYEASVDAPFSHHMTLNLEKLPIPELPEGFIARPMRGEEDAERRATIHRAAWETLPFANGNHKVNSRVTTNSYRNLMNAWPYRRQLDWVIEAPNGIFVASCCVWLDDRNGVGEMEPVGTHPQYRGGRLARAVCLYALHALRELGATEAIVYARGDEAYPVPEKLYRGMGFSPYARTFTFIRRRCPNSSATYEAREGIKSG